MTIDKFGKLSVGLLAGMLLGFPLELSALNRIQNNGRQVQGYFTSSRGRIDYVIEVHATGISGRVEYARCSDGSFFVRLVPSFHFGSELFYQDFDGDGLVDKIESTTGYFLIREEIPIKETLARVQDYSLNKEKFGEADKLLRQLMQ